MINALLMLKIISFSFNQNIKHTSLCLQHLKCPFCVFNHQTFEVSPSLAELFFFKKKPHIFIQKRQLTEICSPFCQTFKVFYTSPKQKKIDKFPPAFSSLRLTIHRPTEDGRAVATRVTFIRCHMGEGAKSAKRWKAFAVFCTRVRNYRERPRSRPVAANLVG